MNRLYVICEGDDDQQFFEHVVEPRLPYATHEVEYFQYAQSTHEEVRDFIHSIQSMQENGIDADYLFLRDYDQAPCKASRFDEIDRQYDELVARDWTFLVVQMIESWYVAGLQNQHDVSGLADAPSQTNTLLKQDFSSMLEESVGRIETLQEILKYFDLERARYKNDSLEYFCSAVLD